MLDNSLQGGNNESLNWTVKSVSYQNDTLTSIDAFWDYF